MEETAFDFCRTCKVDHKCCTNVKHDAEIELPYLTQEDTTRIERATGLTLPEFAEVTQDEHGQDVLSLRAHEDGGCRFYERGRCQIYEVRPLDCRLFPLDIFRIDGELCWVIYHAFCRQPIDVHQLRQYGQSLLARYNPDLDGFARDVKTSPPRLAYSLIGPIDAAVRGDHLLDRRVRSLKERR